MSRFWVWGVRNPCVLLGALAAAAALNGVADRSIAFTTLLVFGLLADAANHVARRARSKERRARDARNALRAASELRESFHHRKAA
ncbi:MAG: hypothetical protein ABIP13_08190 [Tepidiformaceae bacterium]